MKLEDVKEVKICYSEQDVNSFLGQSYIIKKIISSKHSSNGEDVITPCFVLVK